MDGLYQSDVLDAPADSKDNEHHKIIMDPVQGLPVGTPVLSESVVVGVNVVSVFDTIENQEEILEDDVIAMQRIIRKIIKKEIKIKGTKKQEDVLISKLFDDLSDLSTFLDTSLQLTQICAVHAQDASVLSPQSFKYHNNKQGYTVAIQGIIDNLNQYLDQHNLPPSAANAANFSGKHVSVDARSCFTDLIKELTLIMEHNTTTYRQKLSNACATLDKLLVAIKSTDTKAESNLAQVENIRRYLNSLEDQNFD